MTIPAPSVLVQGIQQCKQQTLNPYKAKLDSIDQRRTQRNAVKVSAIVAAHECCGGGVVTQGNTGERLELWLEDLGC